MHAHPGKDDIKCTLQAASCKNVPEISRPNNGPEKIVQCIVCPELMVGFLRPQKLKLLKTLYNMCSGQTISDLVTQLNVPLK